MAELVYSSKEGKNTPKHVQVHQIKKRQVKQRPNFKCTSWYSCHRPHTGYSVNRMTRSAALRFKEQSENSK